MTRLASLKTQQSSQGKAEKHVESGPTRNTKRRKTLGKMHPKTGNRANMQKKVPAALQHSWAIPLPPEGWVKPNPAVLVLMQDPWASVTVSDCARHSAVLAERTHAVAVNLVAGVAGSVAELIGASALRMCIGWCLLVPAKMVFLAKTAAHAALAIVKSLAVGAAAAVSVATKEHNTPDGCMSLVRDKEKPHKSGWHTSVCEMISDE